MHSNSSLEDNFRLVTTQKKALKKLGIKTVYDLLFHFPIRHSETTEQKQVGGLNIGETVMLHGRINKLETRKGFRSKIPMTRAVFEDATGKIRLVWFHQPYIAKMIKEGSIVQITGKITEDKQGLYIANPETDTNPVTNGKTKTLFGEPEIDSDLTQLFPVYPESRGITSRWFYYTLKKILANKIHETLTDPLPAEILKKYHLPSLNTALVWIHQPRNQQDAEVARKRFAFEEIFFIQLDRQKMRTEYQSNPSFSITPPTGSVTNFIKRFPFELTKGQDRAIKQVLSDFRSGYSNVSLIGG